MQFADVYLFEKKTDSNPVEWKQVEVLFESNGIQNTAPSFEVAINLEEELERLRPFEGELLRLRTIEVDDDEIPTRYLCYDLANWSFSGNRLIVTNPIENVHQYTLPFN
ncbi:hypothetical protein D1953_10090 [Peribacillus asahii]|uniref:Uncharacterized protein n=1 Tax=Peribacillus asahii TaxID=228899 RepID=A0A398B821_9BACI|nr:hypothetical protein [Peribacillus asahii]RID86115.1 hypothetical protein D1953_10090 [Peribacillus asahii]